MKKILFPALLFALSFMLTGACTPKDEVSPDDISNGTMTCNVNGKAWKADETLGGLVPGLGGVSIYGDAGNSSIIMAFEDVLLKSGATIVLKEELLAGLNFQLTGYNFNGKDYNASSGSIVITSVTKTDIKGTFSFKAYDNDNKNDIVSITDGKFDMPFNR